MNTSKTLIMRVGMLWRGNKDEDIYDTIVAAASHHFAKFGVVPQYCHVHPDMFEKKEIIGETGAMKIIADKTILPNHVWIGVIS